MNGKAADQTVIMQTITPVLSNAFQALAPICVAVVEQGRHEHNMFWFPFFHPVGVYVQNRKSG